MMNDRDELAAAWPELPDLQGVDRFAEHPVAGLPDEAWQAFKAQERRAEHEGLVDMIAVLREAFFAVEPDAYHDHRFGDMMGSPASVLHYVTCYLKEKAGSA